ncbi:hypothetical protein ACFWOL_29750 [Streptomyces sp. NPDC058442]|uniref:hypothetical protein n=1 Tax=Streptomyces sp. NPDC058442 TaxID=3346503 RepID=UPI003665A606
MNDAVPQPEGTQQPPPRAEPAAPPVEDTTSRTAPEYAPAAPAPLNVPRTPTGDAEVDARLERLADADHLTTDGHVEVYENVHRGLRDALTALDARPGPPAPTPHRGPSGHQPTRHPTTTPHRGPSGHQSNSPHRQGS